MLPAEFGPGEKYVLVNRKEKVDGVDVCHGVYVDASDLYLRAIKKSQSSNVLFEDEVTGKEQRHAFKALVRETVSTDVIESAQSVNYNDLSRLPPSSIELPLERVHAALGQVAGLSKNMAGAVQSDWDTGSKLALRDLAWAIAESTRLTRVRKSVEGQMNGDQTVMTEEHQQLVVDWNGMAKVLHADLKKPGCWRGWGSSWTQEKCYRHYYSADKYFNVLDELRVVKPP